MTTIPGYEIIKELGHGGMATVYLARQESLEREVALKLMAPALAADRSFSERFLREGKTVAQLAHPNIITVHDIGVVDNQHYISMEYVQGGDLKSRIHNDGLSTSEIIRIICDVCRALDYAHSKGFIHRDVKPENILFRSDGTAILTDFGIAKAISSDTRMTATGMSIGTLHYMSPEQARVKTLDGRSDLYSLGVVLFEMLTGKVPYDAEDTLAVAYSHVNDPIPELPAVHAGFQSVLYRMLAKEPDQRFGRCSEVITALEALLPDKEDVKTAEPELGTIVAPPPKKQKRSNTSLVIAFSIIAIAGLSALLGYWLWEPGAPSEPATDHSENTESTPAPIDTPPAPVPDVDPPPAVLTEEPPVDTQQSDTAETVAFNAIVDITSDPTGATIELDGEPLGKTPFYSEEMPAGNHALIITHPYFEPQTINAELASDTVFKQHFELLAGKGSITVLTDPAGATIRINGKSYPDLTPVTINDVTAGEKEIAVSLPKHRPFQTKIDLQHNKTERLEIVLEGGDIKTWKYRDQYLEQEAYIAALLKDADAHRKANRLTEPAGRNALEIYREIVGIEVNNTRAREGISSIAAFYINLAQKALKRFDLDNSKTYLSKARKIDRNIKGAKELESKLIKAYEPEGRIFRDTLADGSNGPEMVAVLEGSFRMGNILDDAGPDEKPVHQVTFAAPFAIGRYEITFAEYDRFAQATGQSKLDDNGWGRKDRPAINVTWKEATAYAQWLSSQTGHTYRLPSEAEWEYAARAGTRTRYSWGNEAGANLANCKQCGSSWDNKQTAPVGSFSSNPYGLFDVHGNVWEWISDCVNPDYKNAPTDGSSWFNGNCKQRILRGGSWISRPPFIRSANRGHAEPETRYSYYGFRLVRELR